MGAHMPVIERAATDADDWFMTPAEVAERHRKTVETLANERSRGEGLPFLKHGGKVLYRMSDVVAWETANMRGFTWSDLADAVRSYRGLAPAEADKLIEHIKRRMGERSA